ncbi:hypothetical protein K1T71_004742 [Dendrolimus kikuchii]|uniref:Uncharacterized protein n=1 Tax=Dendrolimus kikuchii TaxID=765133 RepID=A0ACC1D921_9NEOP|nr:hypothetical protein K1T71_004742 [Dendrolimus kikuchii]
MLRFVTLTVALALAAAGPNPYQGIFQIDISPEEAQKYLANPPFTDPQLSGRTAVLPLVKYNDPSFRTAEAGPTLGHYWKNGKEIENTNDYLEEVYNARQYHGQDGLGAYVYGYETPESAKAENRVRSGNVAGAYTYKSPDNKDPIKVRYWADSQGFHQEDNLPKVVLTPQEEAPDVKAARIAHEKAWAEAAAAARKQPDPQFYLHRGEYYPANNYQAQASEQQATYVAAPLEGQASEQKPTYVAAPLEGQASEQKPTYIAAPLEGQASAQQATYVAAPVEGQAREGKSYSGVPSGYPSTTPKYYEETEPTGPPRGFFYSYEYPVSIIVPKNQETPNYSGYSDAVSVNSARQ